MGNTMKNRFPKWLRRSAAALGLSLTTLVSTSLAIDLSSAPMETNITPAPPSLMFAIDDSGSMNFEYLSPLGDTVVSADVYDPNLLRRTPEKNYFAFNPSTSYTPWYPNLAAGPNTAYIFPEADSAGAGYSLNSALLKIQIDLSAAGHAYGVLPSNYLKGLSAPSGGGTSSGTSIASAEFERAYYYNNTGAASATGKTSVASISLVTGWKTFYPCFAVLPANTEEKTLPGMSGTSLPTSITYFYSSTSSTPSSMSSRTFTPALMSSGNYVCDTGNLITTTASTYYLGVSFSAQAATYHSFSAVGLLPYNWPTASLKISEVYSIVRSPSTGNYYLVFIDKVSGNIKYLQYTSSTANWNTMTAATQTLNSTQLKLADTFTVVAPPADIRPAATQADGSTVYKTADELRQDYANFYQYSRSRQSAAKNALGKAISSVRGMRVGYYYINSDSQNGATSPRAQSVLPVHLALGNEVIVDDTSAVYDSSKWSSSSSTSDTHYSTGSRYSKSTTATASSAQAFRWVPTISTAGMYSVSVWYPAAIKQDPSACYKVISSSGTTPCLSVNQTSATGGRWVDLPGLYSFNTGTGNSVELWRTTTNSTIATAADAVRFVNTSVTTTSDSTQQLLQQLYYRFSSGGTPLPNALETIGRYYANYTAAANPIGPAPYALESDGGACQQSFTILMTDGYWNSALSSTTGPSLTNMLGANSTSITGADAGTGVPFQDTNASATLADISMYYYKNDLNPTITNQVPTSSCDQANWQHMVTYSMSLGLTPSAANPAAYNSCLQLTTLPYTAPVWPAIPANGSETPIAIDDLWHAAVNGRGTYLNATDSESFISALQTLMVSIASRTASAASVTLSTQDLQSTTDLYQSTYDPSTWTGDIRQWPLDADGSVDTSTLPTWSAQSRLDATDWNTGRTLLTYNGTTSVPFRAANFTTAMQSKLTSTWAATGASLINFLRGDDSNPAYRNRVHALGDIVHSAPTLVGQTVYAGANDGMLHAFDVATGNERFAYIPGQMLPSLSSLANPMYSHLAYVDKTPYVQYVSDTLNGNPIKMLMLVGGFNSGAAGYYALDITDADATAPCITSACPSKESTTTIKALWEYPRSSYLGGVDADLGYSFSDAYIMKSNATSNPRVVVFGNGYNSGTGHAVLYFLDAYKGTIVAKIDTGIGSDNGLSSPSLVDENGDGKIDIAYAGDLKGNMWKFDVSDPNPANWKVAFKNGAVNMPLFTALSSTGTPQPITTKPTIMDSCAASGAGRMVIFGTGKFLGVTDTNPTTELQTLYGLWDYATLAETSKYLGTLTNHSAGVLTGPSGGITLTKQTVLTDYTSAGEYFRILTGEIPSYLLTASNVPMAGTEAGWFFDLPGWDSQTGERITERMLVVDGRLVVVSMLPKIDNCTGGGQSMVSFQNACTGGLLYHESFDVNGDQLLSDADRVNVTIDGVTKRVSPTGRRYNGLVKTPAILNSSSSEAIAYLSGVATSSGSAGIVSVITKGEKEGVVYWMEE